jgi:hypothetical protein
MSDSEEHAKQARELVALGYPGVESRLPEAMEWLQDANCSAFGIIASFLVTVGRPVIPHVRKVLSGTDAQWKCWVISALVCQWPKEIIQELTRELESMSLWEDDAGADVAALALLAKHLLGDVDGLKRLLRTKKQACQHRLADLGEIERALQ